MRIFIGLTEIAGYYKNLRMGFEQIGIDAVFVNLSGHPFKYEGGTKNLLVRWVEHAGAKRASTPRSNLPVKLWWIGLRQLLLVPLFLWAAARFDVFIFGYNSTFFRFREIPLLKLLGKKIIYVFHGSDARPSYIDGSEMAPERNVTTEECIELTRNKRKTVSRIERAVDIIIAQSTYAHFFHKPLVPFVRMGLPYNVPEAVAGAERLGVDGNIQVRILHSPSHPTAKGTPAIREAIKRLQERGLPIEFVEIEGKPNSVVLQALSKCDFVIDQLYSDIQMAGFPTEAAWYGKPAIVGGYAAQEIARTFPPDEIPPAHYCHPDCLEEAIEKLVTDSEYRVDLGRRARLFVAENWSPRKVAERYEQVINGRLPADWLLDPGDARYLHGAGLAEQRVKELVRAVIEKGGKEALQLYDKPELERLFQEFAGLEAD